MATIPLTLAQKRAIASVLIYNAGNLVEKLRAGETAYMDEIADLDPDSVAQQLAVWLKNFPGSSWDNRLPDV